MNPVRIQMLADAQWKRLPKTVTKNMRIRTYRTANVDIGDYIASAYYELVSVSYSSSDKATDLQIATSCVSQAMKACNEQRKLVFTIPLSNGFNYDRYGIWFYGYEITEEESVFFESLLSSTDLVPWMAYCDWLNENGYDIPATVIRHVLTISQGVM